MTIRRHRREREREKETMEGEENFGEIDLDRYLLLLVIIISSYNQKIARR
jgi:hypothetical protein